MVLCLTDVTGVCGAVLQTVTLRHRLVDAAWECEILAEVREHVSVRKVVVMLSIGVRQASQRDGVHGVHGVHGQCQCQCQCQCV